MALAWERTFTIIKVLTNGSYQLVDLCDRNMPKKNTKVKKRKHGEVPSDEEYEETDWP
jgi:hypothetical protein